MKNFGGGGVHESSMFLYFKILWFIIYVIAHFMNLLLKTTECWIKDV